MVPVCAWSYNHRGGEVPLATNTCILPGENDGGTEWFGGSEPPIKLNLCDSCTEEFVRLNGGPEMVDVEPIAIVLPEGNPFSPSRREMID